MLTPLITHLAAAARRYQIALLFSLALLTMGAGVQSPSRPQAATPTPEPTPAPTQQPPITIVIPPSGGQTSNQPQDTAAPMIVVESYTTAPNPVKSGAAFSLNVTVKNIGSKHADSVIVSVGNNNSFVGLGAPAQVGKLEPGASASFTVQVQAGKLNAGAYDLPLQFSYRIGESGELGVTRSVGITVEGGTGVAGRPQVVIQSATPRAVPGSAGEPFDVDIVLKNVGPRAAYGVSAALKLNEALSPAQGSGSVQLGNLEAGKTVTFTVSLVLNKVSTSGRVAQTLALEYRDSASTKYNAEETASLDLGAAGRQSPQLIVTGQATTPERPAPGETFTLSVNVSNVGSGAAKRVLMRLGGEAGLKPFIPVGSSNVSFAAELAAGATTTFTQTLLMDGAASGGAYSLTVSLAYENALGEAKTENEQIGLLAPARPQLKIGLTKPLSDSVAAGQTFDLAVELINIGRQKLDVSTVEITSDDLKLTKNSLYIGPLDPSISGALTAKATATKAGPARFKVIVHYRDDLNQMQTIEQEMAVEVHAANPLAPQSTAPAQSGGLWQAILQFFGLGG
jgi:hypothetical protein